MCTQSKVSDPLVADLLIQDRGVESTKTERQSLCLRAWNQRKAKMSDITWLFQGDNNWLLAIPIVLGIFCLLAKYWPKKAK